MANRVKLTLSGAVVALWLALAAGMLGAYAWPFDLFAHFRIHYGVLFALLAAALLLRKRQLAALGALFGAVISVAPVVEYVTAPVQVATAHADAFRLVSLNIWFRNHDYARIAEFLNETDADAIVLQEATGSAARQLHKLLPAYPYAHIDSAWHGSAVFSRWPVIAASSPPLAKLGSRAALVQIDWRGSALTVLGVHLHWPLGRRSARLRNQELASIAAFARAATGPLVVAGDLNITAWSPIFQEMVGESGLTDCARASGVEATWPSHTVWLGIQIDHCLASRHWQVVDMRRGPHVGSDHRPLIVDLALVTPTGSSAGVRLEPDRALSH